MRSNYDLYNLNLSALLLLSLVLPHGPSPHLPASMAPTPMIRLPEASSFPLLQHHQSHQQQQPSLPPLTTSVPRLLPSPFSLEVEKIHVHLPTSTIPSSSFAQSRSIFIPPTCLSAREYVANQYLPPDAPRGFAQSIPKKPWIRSRYRSSRKCVIQLPAVPAAVPPSPPSSISPSPPAKLSNPAPVAPVGAVKGRIVQGFGVRPSRANPFLLLLKH